MELFYQPTLEIPCSLNSPAFYNASSAGMCPIQLKEYVAEGLTESIQRYNSDNSTKAAWDSIQSFVSTKSSLAQPRYNFPASVPGYWKGLSFMKASKSKVHSP